MQEKIQAVTFILAKFGGLVIKSTAAYSHFLIETAQLPTELQYFWVCHGCSHSHQHPNFLINSTPLLIFLIILPVVSSLALPY